MGLLLLLLARKGAGPPSLWHAGVHTLLGCVQIPGPSGTGAPVRFDPSAFLSQLEQVCANYSQAGWLAAFGDRAHAGKQSLQLFQDFPLLSQYSSSSPCVYAAAVASPTARQGCRSTPDTCAPSAGAGHGQQAGRCQ